MAATKATYQFDLFAHIETAERSSRRHMSVLAGVPTAPVFKNAADVVVAHQAIVAALRAAMLTGPLDSDGLGRALMVVRAVRDAYVFLGDSRTVSETLNAVVNVCQEHAIRALESVEG